MLQSILASVDMLISLYISSPMSYLFRQLFEMKRISLLKMIVLFFSIFFFFFFFFFSLNLTK
jgi:hypothetical protein